VIFIFLFFYKESFMKNMLLLTSLLAVPVVAADTDGAMKPADVIAKIDQKVGWFKSLAPDERQALLDAIAWKVENAREAVRSFVEGIKDRISSEQKERLLKLHEQMKEVVQKIKAMPAEEKARWRAVISDKIVDFKDNIDMYRGAIKESLTQEQKEMLKNLQQKVHKLVDWVKSMPPTDRDALRQMLVRKGGDVRGYISLLQDKYNADFKRLGRQVEELEKSKTEAIAELKDKLIQLYEEAKKAIQQLP
jgi:hypothetical protein